MKIIELNGQLVAKAVVMQTTDHYRRRVLEGGLQAGEMREGPVAPVPKYIGMGLCRTIGSTDMWYYLRIRIHEVCSVGGRHWPGAMLIGY